MVALLPMILLLPTAALQGVQPEKEAREPSDEIVVTGSRSRPPPDPLAIFREHCFDANRLTGRAASPGAGWFSLDPETRQARRITEPSAAAFEKIDEGFNVAMMLQIDERPYHKSLIQHRCSLKTFGSPAPSKLADGISRMFGGAGARHHLGYETEEKAIPGWTQWRWTGAPAPSSQQWRVYASGKLLSVLLDSFYGVKSYLVVDLKFSNDPDRPASVMTLVHIYDPKVFCRPALRRNSAGCVDAPEQVAGRE